MIPYYYVEKRGDCFVFTHRGGVVVSANDILTLVAGISDIRETQKDIAVYCGAVDDIDVRRQQQSLSLEENKEFWNLYNSL